jgi:nucleotide-binding universal stress UspA family protein
MDPQHRLDSKVCQTHRRRDGYVSVLHRDGTKQILDAAREIGATAIFVGRAGQGRLPGLLLGSVSQKLAWLAPTLLVIVP